jgi:hypothetical protein
MCSIVVLVYSHPNIENYSYKITRLVSKIEFVVEKYFSLYKITPPAKKHYSLYVVDNYFILFFRMARNQSMKRGVFSLPWEYFLNENNIQETKICFVRRI